MIPKIENFSCLGGELPFCLPIRIFPTDNLLALAQTVEYSYGDMFSNGSFTSGKHNQTAIFFNQTLGLGKEGYSITIDRNIEISYSDECGAFYALMSVRQMLLNGLLLRCRIQDEPMLQVRGYMLDVSRGKIPMLDTLKKLVDMLASFKYNHLELYFEGSPFIYRGYQQFANADALTPKDMRNLDKYCSERYMDLTPNLNTLGHMSPWLAHKEFKYLAEKEDGLDILGINFPPTTLDCRNPKALEFAVSLIDGIIPNFQSRHINVGLDEPFELGEGKNAAAAQAVGKDRLYLEYVKKLHGEIKNRHKTMLMWGDVATCSTDIAKEVPQDIILLDWGYQAEYPFDNRAASLANLGKRFILCPGTSSWQSIGGITDNMLQNVINATKAAHKHGALGIILTDWGDGGHLQHSFVSTPAILLASACSWSDSCQEDYLQMAINKLVYLDASANIGKLIMDIGRYVNFEERLLESRTLATLPLLFPQARGSKISAIEEGLIKITLNMLPQDLKAVYDKKMSKTKPFDIIGFELFIAKLQSQLEQLHLQCIDADIVAAEISNTLALIATLERARLSLLQNRGDKAIASELRIIASEHQRLWQQRNRNEGANSGLKKLEALAQNLDAN